MRILKKGTRFIYAIAGIDARGLTSSYSEQVKVRFNVVKNKLIVNRISPKGAPKPYPNIYLDGDIFVDTMRSSGASRMRVYFDPEYYDVVRTMRIPDSDATTTLSQNLISDKYKIQIINLDLQESQLLNLGVADETGAPLDVPITSATLKTLIT